MEALLHYSQRYPLEVVAVFSVLLPLLVFGYKRAYTHPGYRYLWFYLLVKTLLGFVMLVLAAHTQNTLWLYHLEILIGFTFITYFFSAIMQRRIPRWIPRVFLTFFWIFTLYDISIANPNLTDWHNHAMVFYAHTLQSICISAFALYYLYETLRYLPTENILTDTSFWCISGLLLYHSIHVITTPFMHYMFKWDNQLDIKLVILMGTSFEIIYLILTSIGAFFFHNKAYAGSR